uniref:hydroxymethylglutaryl-CoA lyase n=1 Tax=Macrostomum lignano TaxID=282301 RepID=A0A1I8I387_9PLAT
MPSCGRCCPRDGFYRSNRSLLRLEPHRFHRWLLAAGSSNEDQPEDEAELRRLLADSSLAVQLKPASAELRRMQSYSRWKVSMQLNHLLSWFNPDSSGAKRVVLIRQLEPLPPRLSAALRDAMPYLRAYFPCLDLQLQPECGFLAARDDVVRREIKGSIRFEAGSLLRCLLLHHPTATAATGASVQVGVCHTDLYPGPDMLGPGQNGAFILGQSSAMHKAAVVCFGRGSSAPINDGVLDDGESDGAGGNPLTSADWRVRKVLSHELGHLLGLDHCCCFACNMNGSESMAAALTQPLELCPLCLAKVCRLFSGCLLTPAAWAESVLTCLCPDVHPEGSQLKQSVQASVERLKIYSKLDGFHPVSRISQFALPEAPSMLRRLLSGQARGRGRVTVYEVGPRDGLQNEKQPVPLAAKIRLVDLLSASGLTKIEAGSFVSGKWVPQMASSDAVLGGISKKPGVVYAALTPNLRGFEAALAAGADEVAVFGAASEAFSRRNVNCDVEESLRRFKPVAEAALKAKVPLRGYVSCVLGCPYQGKVSHSAVTSVAHRLLELGCYEVSLGDTIGVGTPDTMSRLLESLLNSGLRPTHLAAHCHNTNGQALANISAALRFELRTIDASVAGLGGCPYAGPGASGNVATEAVVAMLHSNGYETGIDATKLGEAGDFIRGVLTCVSYSILMIHLCGRSLQFAFKPLHRLFSKPASKPAPLDLSKFDTSLIRNFSIIAHVDHGKSTLSDRLLECTGAIQAGPQNQQVLDRLKIERDRGITIKAQTVALFYQSPSTGSTYLLNLVDTPGHVDFSHEVHRSVAASDGVVLLVDANDGVQAQTIANYFLAFTAELPIIPVINKIDLPNAKPDEVKKQLQSLFGIEPDQVIEVSAKKAINIDQLLEAIVHRIPPPSTADQADHRSSSFKGLIVDSWFEPYKGAVCLVAAKSGLLKPGDEFRSLHQPKIAHTVKEVGVFRPEPQPIDSLSCGLVGYLISSMRSTREALVGDTVVGGGGSSDENSKDEPLTPF